jgi:hypothetical protein
MLSNSLVALPDDENSQISFREDARLLANSDMSAIGCGPDVAAASLNRRLWDPKRTCASQISPRTRECRIDR